MRPASWLCQQQLSQDTVWGHMQVCGSAARALQSSLAWDSCNPVAVRTEMEYDTVLGTRGAARFYGGGRLLCILPVMLVLLRTLSACRVAGSRQQASRPLLTHWHGPC